MDLMRIHEATEYQFTHSPVNEFDKPVTRTKKDYPYSYDGFVVYRGGMNKQSNTTMYSDRMHQWDASKYKASCEKAFDKEPQTFSNANPMLVQEFLREYTQQPNLRLILIMEYCNLASGYPVWRFDCNIPQEVV